MHYGDKEQLELNYLDLVLYKHGVIDEDDRDFVVDMTSIQDCRYVRPHTLKEFLKNNIDYDYDAHKLDAILADESKYPSDNYYLVRFRFTGENDNFDVMGIKNIDIETDNPFYGLH